jgi:hypothetical protein
MANFTDYLENKIIDHILRNQAFTPPAAVYVGLFTTNPTADTGAGGTECSGTSYVRKSLALDAGNAGATSNTSEVAFPTAGSNWGSITGFGVWDAASSGNLLMWGVFDPAVTVNTGDTAKFAAGALDITID